MTTESSKAKFFRQSGWMVFATFIGGFCMFAVHVFAPYLGDREYGLFGTLLAMMNVLLIPSLGLQTTLAHQAAAAMTPTDQAQLAGTMRGLLWYTFILWLAIAFATAIFQPRILEILTITNPLALWLVLVFGLGQLWQPIVFGVLQGRQNFLWLGWGQITNGLGRFIAVAIIVLIFSGKATGAIAGATIGMLLSLAIGFAQSRVVWGAREKLPFDWRSWLAQVIPLTLGLGASQFIFSVDMILVRGIYGEEQTGFYSASGMLGRGLVMFTMPLALVMFPKVVHSVASGRKSNVLFYTLITAAALSTLAASGATLGIWFLKQAAFASSFAADLVPNPILAKLRDHPDAVNALARLIPWFVWCMLPLGLANMLLNNLLARKRYRIVPYLVLTVAAYVAAAVSFADVRPLEQAGASFVRIVQILGISNLVFLGLCAAFTWADWRTGRLVLPKDTEAPEPALGA